MTPCKFLHVALVAVVYAVIPWLQAMAATSATMEFESQALDLDTGTVLDMTSVDVTELPGADVKFGNHADRVPHCVVMPGAEGVELAYLDGAVFDIVTVADVEGLIFSAQPLDVPLEPNDTVVLRTDTGAMFKIGNAVDSGVSVTFDYEQLH